MSVVYVSTIGKRFGFAVSVYVSKICKVAGSVSSVSGIVCENEFNNDRGSAPTRRNVVYAFNGNFGNKLYVYGKLIFFSVNGNDYSRLSCGIRNGRSVYGCFEARVFAR